MKVFKLPPGVDPTTVTSRINLDNGVLLIEGIKHAKDKATDDNFEAKLDFRSFKPEKIKFYLCGNTLTVTGIRHQSRNTHSRCVVLPDDLDPRSVTSSLSKEGLLTIKASRDPATLSRNLVPRVLSLLRESTLVTAGHVSARF